MYCFNRTLSDQSAASDGDAGTGARSRKAANPTLGRRPKDRRSSPTGEPVPPLSTPPGDDQPSASAAAAHGQTGVSGDDRGPKKRAVRLDDRMDVDSPRSTPPGNRSPPLERNRRDRQDGNVGPTPHSQQNRRQSLPGTRTDAPPPPTQRPQPTQRAQPNPSTQAFRSQAPAPAGDGPRAFANNAPASSTGEVRSRQRSTPSAPDPNRRGVARASAWPAGSANAASAAAAGGGDAGPGGGDASTFRSRRTTGSASSTASSSSSASHAAAASVSEWVAPPRLDPALAIHHAAAVLAARRESVGAPGAQYIPGGHQEATQRSRVSQVPRFIPGRGNPNPRAERGPASPRSAPGAAPDFRSRAHYNAPAARHQRAQDDQWARGNRSPSNPSGGEERGGGGRRRRGPDCR